VERVSNQSYVDQIWADFYRESPSLMSFAEPIGNAYSLLQDVLREGGQILVCGNGGSASDSEHIAGELAKPCALERPLGADLRLALRDAGDDGYLSDNLQRGLPVLPLVSQAALITAIVNDQGGDLIFAQQVVVYGRPGDLLWALSTSGNSSNVVYALRTARALGMRTIGFSGIAMSEMSELCDVIVGLPGTSVPTIQHSHQLVYHTLCLAIEADWYSS